MVALILVLLAACGGGGNDTAPLPPQFLASTTTSSTEYKTVVQQLYISYFGRPADTGGLGSFQNQLAALRGPTDIQGLDKAYHTSAAIKSLVDSFGGSAESSALYSGDNTAFVTAIYKNILNRSPDSAGLAFWVGALNGGAATKANVSLSIMAGALVNTSAQGKLDAALVSRKVTVGANFTDALAAAPVNGYSGDAAAAQARAMLTSVTASTDTTAFQANIAALVGKLAASVPSVPVAGAPVITSFSPTSGALGRTVTIAGTNFSTTPAANKVWFNGSATTVSVATATSLTVTVPGNASSGTISAQTAGGVASSTASFTVIPTIATFNPTSGAPGDTVTITGSNFGSQDIVYFWNGNRAQITARSSTSITVTVPYVFSTGQIVIESASGPTVRSADNFVLSDAPKITSFYPTFGPAGTSVTVYGSNFGQTPADNIVRFSGVAAKITFLSLYSVPSFMKVTVPSGPNGVGKISITRTGGTGFSPDDFSVSESAPPSSNNRLSFSPSPLSFGAQTVGGYFFEKVNLTNTGTFSVRIIAATVSGGNFEYRGTSCYGYNYMLEYHDTLAPGASCYVDIGFSPVVGASAGTLSIASTATGSPHSISLSGSGTAALAPVVSLNPASLTFAARELGTASPAQTITLSNTGTAPLSVDSIGVSGEFAQANACPKSLTVGASCAISVTFKPVRFVGPKNGSVAISGSPQTVSLKGVGSLNKSGQLAIFTRQPWGVGNVFVDSTWVGRNLKYDSVNACGGIGAITLTLAPGTHTIEAIDPVLSIAPATATVTEGGCTVHQIIGTSTCVAPNFISNGTCYQYTPPTCAAPKVLQNGVCITPGTGTGSGGTGSGSGTGTGTGTGTGAGESGTNGGMATTFIDSGKGTSATSCLNFGFIKSNSTGQDSQTITNVCGFRVYVMRCHTPSIRPGTKDTECNAVGRNRFFQQFHWMEPGGVEINFYSLPPETTIWYGACSGGTTPHGTEVSLTGNYVCD